MIKNLVSAAICLLLVCSADAQESPMKFGDIPMEDLKMERYENDSSAAAVILNNYSETVFTTHHSYVFIHTRIKVLKKEGLRMGNIIVPVFGNVYRAISNLKASTYNLKNNIIEESKLENSGKFTEDVIDGAEVLKFTMPNVQVGSIIEYSFNVRGINNWAFQDLIPCRSSEYKLIVSDYIELNIALQGYLSPKLYEEKSEYYNSQRCTTHHWIMENVPAFKVEPFIASYKNYISKVTFDLSSASLPGRYQIDFLSNWGKLREHYREGEFIYGEVKNSGFLKKITGEITKNCKTEDEKVLAIYYFVKNQMQWNGRNSTHVWDNNLKKAFEKKEGNSAEINLILLAMLSHSNLIVDPVLIGTRDYGFVRTELLNSDQFNKVIVSTLLDGKFVLLDATEKFLSHEFLPKNCINGLGNGYRAGANSFQWIPIQDNSKTKIVVTTNLDIMDDGSVTGNVSMVKNGYASQELREKIAFKKKEDYLKNLFLNSDAEFKSSVFENIDTLTAKTNERHEFILPNYSQKNNDLIYLNPVIVSRITENPFKTESRVYPIDFGFAGEKTYSVKINIPPGYYVDETPKQMMLLLPDGGGKFIYSCTQNEKEINILTQVVLNKSFFPQTEYHALKEFYNIMAAKQAEQIVLKRK